MLKPVRAAMTGLALLAAAGGLSACSVGMAAAGKPAPDLAVCKVGADRSDVEAALGSPVGVQTLPDGDTTCRYQYEVGNDPSPGRALAHGAMDVLTLGLWEVVGTPVELVQGKTYELAVTYGPDGKAKAIETRPLP